MSAQGDVLVIAGEAFGIEIVNGSIRLTAGFETATQLALFGGNVEDSARASTATKQWWGNLLESDPVRMYRSRTQALLESLPATTGNLRLLEDAAAFDLNFFLAEGIADGLAISISLTGPNRIAFAVKITAEGVEHAFTFTQNWQAAATDEANAADVIAANPGNVEQFDIPTFVASTKSVQVTGSLHFMHTAEAVLGIGDAWTIGIWWHPTTGGSQTLLELKPDSGNANAITILQRGDGLSILQWNATFAFKDYRHLFTPVVDQWYHTVLTHDGVADELRMYLDTVEATGPAITKNTDISGQHQADTARRVKFGGGSVQGYSISLFDSAMSPGEVAALYNNRDELNHNFNYPPPYAGASALQHWYRLGFQAEPDIGADYSEAAGGLPMVSGGAVPVSDFNVETDSPS